MDYQIRWMWSKQDSAHRPGLERWRGRGIVEGGYADGNFNRTSLMYALWKTQGTSVRPWRADVRFGAVRQGEGVALAIDAASGRRRTVNGAELVQGLPIELARGQRSRLVVSRLGGG
jgi:hypothetical protein